MSFWAGRRVLVTGHTGFKGAWLTLWLQRLGAEVTGLSKGPVPEPSLFGAARVHDGIEGIDADVRDSATVHAALRHARPEVVLHLAAQPFVRRSYADPAGTFDVNVMGTVNVLDAARATDAVQAVVVVTSDKAYANDGSGRAFTEDDPVGGHDPYSASKACADLVTSAYARSFFSEPGAARVASARAGNVIGGGDWGEDRLVPDIVRGALAGEPVPIRHPEAVRPWQHVLNPLSGYLRLAEALHASEVAGGAWNFGPDPADTQPVRRLAELMAQRWPGLEFDVAPGPHPPEAPTLALDSGKARVQLGWTPVWDLTAGLQATVDWHRAHADAQEMRAFSLEQLESFSAGSTVGGPTTSTLRP